MTTDLENFYDYEKTISEEKRINLGIVYTPIEIVDFINREALSLWEGNEPPRFYDPCCGTGIFLYDMAKKVSERYSLNIDDVYEKYAFGEDVDKSAIEVAERAIPGSNVSVVESSLDSDFSQYDIVITNPPYIRIQNLPELLREKLRKEYDFCSGDTDIYMAFFEKVVKSGAISGMIFPNSWMKNKSGDTARKYLSHTGRVNTLINFESKKVFENVGTYTNIIILGEKKGESIKVSNSLENTLKSMEYEKVLSPSGTVVTNSEDIRFVEEIQTNRKTSFYDVCEVKTGLATLCDTVFCLELVSPELQPGMIVEVKGRKANSDTFRIESDIVKPCIRAGDITKNTDKNYVMLYPYRDLNPIGEELLEKEFPLAYSYLKDNVEKLNNRDKGKCREKNYDWTMFGRTQALDLINKDKLVFPSMVNDKMSYKRARPGTTFVSGFCFVPKDGVAFEELEEHLASKDFMRWAKIFGKNMGSGWSGISSQTFINYKV